MARAQIQQRLSPGVLMHGYRVTWASSQYGGLRVMRLPTWEVRAPRTGVPTIKVKLHSLLWLTSRSHTVSLLLTLDQSSHRPPRPKWGTQTHLLMWEYQRVCSHILKRKSHSLQWYQLPDGVTQLPERKVCHGSTLCFGYTEGWGIGSAQCQQHSPKRQSED